MSDSNMPEEIQIGPYTFTVDVDQEYIEAFAQSRTHEVAGISEFSKQKITLFPVDGVDHEADTLIHEIIHMCLRAVSCDIEAEVASGRREDLEERLVAPLATILLDTLRRNPDLVIYLLKPRIE